MNLSRLSLLFFLTLSVAIFAWWVAILISADFRSLFFTSPFSQGKYLLFLSADLCVIGCGSLAVSWFAIRRQPLAEAFAAWLVTGALCYATLCTFSLFKLGDCTLLSIATMVVGAIGCIIVTIALSRTARSGFDQGTSKLND